jgi:hypothetical protein
LDQYQSTAVAHSVNVNVDVDNRNPEARHLVMSITVTSPATIAARRGPRLAAAIEEATLRPVSTVAVMCCPDHADDGDAAVAAAAVLGVRVLEIPADVPSRALAQLLRDGSASVLLACEHGTETWLAAHAPIIVLGDGLGVRWWRSAELCASPENYLDRDPYLAGRLVAEQADGTWVVIPS